MPDHTPQHGRRPHFHRGRRGPDRRGTDRRAQQAQGEGAARETSPREGSVDVEQIMRDIRSRIAQRHGVDLSTQQIQELAARRLEAILEPRNIKPQLLEQLRKNAAAPELPAPASEGFTFEDTTLYDTHRGILRFFRKLLNPILKLFFNPQPLIHALNTQARLNREFAAREAERERRQAEWNALHYELLQRMVTEVARVSIEVQSLMHRVESLSTKVDFNERRVRSLETLPPPASQRQQPRQQPEPPAAAVASPAPETGGSEPAAATEAGAEGPRRRRRRRRGRRSGAPVEGAAAAAETGGDVDEGDVPDVESEEEESTTANAEWSPAVTSSVEPQTAIDADVPAAPLREAMQPQEPPREPLTIAAPAPEPLHEPLQPSPPPDEPVPASPDAATPETTPRPQEPTER